MRVISGTAGGLLLKSPRKYELRPTQDRIRQVIFSSLAERVPDAHVLDLYAGTGSLGIEALSRGGRFRDLRGKGPEAAQCIRENLQHCRLTGDVRQGDVLAWLDNPPPRPFDLIFADPPYVKEKGPLKNDLPLDRLASFLAPDGLLIWEHSAERTPEGLAGCNIVRQRAYGGNGAHLSKFFT